MSLHALVKMMRNMAYVLTQSRVVNVAGRFHEAVKEFHPFCAATNPLEECGESLPRLQRAVCTFINKEKDNIDVRFDSGLLRTKVIVFHVKAAECEEIRSGLIETVLLCAQRDAKAFKN